jgi:hypothetical protein
MVNRNQYQSRLQATVRKMINRKMTVTSLITREGKMIHHINGYILTGEQILELDSAGRLTPWGIVEFARGYVGE